MLVWTIFFGLCFSIWPSNTIIKEREVFGILIYVKKAHVQELRNNHQFTKIKKFYSLKEKKYYSIAEILSLEAPHKSESPELLSACKEIKKIRFVISCELNVKITPESKEDDECLEPLALPTILPTIPLSNGLYAVLKKLYAVLTKRCPYPPLVEGEEWDIFWAQNYTGADLLREEIKKLDTPFHPASIIGIWDDSSKHGEHVSQIIAGQKSSAVIPSNSPIVPVETSYGEDYIEGYESFMRNCREQNHCPIYINNSMGWGPSGDVMPRLASSMHSMGTTIITSAGNGYQPVGRLKRQSASEGHIIVVASLAPNGHPSDFTNYGDSVTISAPSDNSIKSYDFENNPNDFGGTSGATPLVTGTLGGFTLLSGYALQTHEAKILLEKTAIPLPYLPSSHLLGAGMLNSYKMGMVALKMKEQCQNYDSTDQRNECMSRLLREEETYNFESESKKMFDEAIKFFPNCLRENNNQEDIQEKDNCKKEEALNNLRRSALLNSSDPKMWQALACVTENFSIQTADFYSSLIERETVGNPCQYNTQLVEYFSKSSFMNLMENEECNFNNKVDQDDLDAQFLAWIAIVVLSILDETPNAHKILEKIFNHNEFNNINTDNMSIIISSIDNIFDKLSEKNSQIFLEKIIDQPNNSKASLSNIIYTFRDNLDQITHPHILFEKAIDKENLSGHAQLVLVEIANSNTFYTMENSDELLVRFIDKIDSSYAFHPIIQSLGTRLEQGTKVEKLLIKIAEHNHHDDQSIYRLIKLVDDNFDKISNVHKILEKDH